MLRFIAALCVVLYHYTFRGFAANSWSILEFKSAGSIFRYGYLGVDLFFIISGFVIALSIQNYNLWGFIKSRITRLYPAYWFCVTLTFFAILFFGGPVFTATWPQYIANLSMFHRFMGFDHIDTVYWTLLVEMKFYLLIAIYLIICQKKHFSLDYLIYIWLAISFLPLVVDFKTALPLKAIDYIFALNFSPYFIAGMLFYKIHLKGNSAKYLTALLLSLLLSVINGIQYIELQKMYLGVQLSPVVVTLVITSFFIIMYLISTGMLNKLNSPHFLKIGALTYPLYLIHQNTGFIIFNNLGNTLNKYVLLTGTVAAMLAASYLINSYIEVPVARFLKKRLSRLSWHRLK